MKRIFPFSLAFAIFLIGFTGCIATHVGTMSDSASLGSANFSYKKQNLTGESKAVYILGIGGEARKSLVWEAKQKLMAKNQLQSNQALANLSVSYKTGYYLGPLIMAVRCVVSADIVEFHNGIQVQATIQEAKPHPAAPEVQPVTTPLIRLEPAQPVSQPEEQEQKITYIPLNLSVSDNVFIVNYFSSPVEGKVIGFKDNKVVVEYKNKRNKIKTATLLEYQVQKKTDQ